MRGLGNIYGPYDLLPAGLVSGLGDSVSLIYAWALRENQSLGLILISTGGRLQCTVHVLLGLGFYIQGMMGFGCQDLRFGLSGLGVQGLRFRGLGFRV